MGRTLPWDIAIVGGGASGTLLAANLLRRARAPLRLLLLERGGRVGRGLAYSTESPSHLLNVPAGRMSAFADEPEHFLRWVRRVEPGTGPGDFVQRRRYGQYLEAVLHEALEAAAPGVQLLGMGAEVTALEVERGLVRLGLAGGGEQVARRVVLALGNAPPADLRVRDGGLYTSPRYRRSPWCEGGLRHIAPEDTVLLVGTGLTMVDAVLSLEEQGHRGPLQALSRHGLLPRVHRPGGAPGLPPPPLPEAPRVRALLRGLREDIERVWEGGGDWRSAVDALRPVTVPLWRRLSLDERRRFLRHLRAFWDVHRHRMAPEVGDTLGRLRREGRLRLHAGRVRAFRLVDGGVEALYRPRGAEGEAVLRAHHVINCTGPEGAITRDSQPLLRGLLRAGLARADALELGLATSEAGALVDAAGRASEHLFTLGPPRRGDLWEATAVPEIRAQARALAEHLLRPERLQREAPRFIEAEPSQP
jgi:uncharacterized NAD(P)/FAD-binding protein YdhS